MYHTVFNTQTLPDSMNNTFFCLIPKFSNANLLKNFCPISLCNTTYKIITKIIANQIKPHLIRLISPYQASFLKGCWACDNAILVQELVTHITRSSTKSASLILKLDLEKSFDRLEWSFVYRTLLFFKFPPKFTRLIMHCISSSNISVLVKDKLFLSLSGNSTR